MTQSRLIIALCAFCLLASVGSSAGKTVAVIADRITLDDLIATTSPSLQKLMARGAVGLMNPATGGPGASDRAYLTLGSGSYPDHTGLPALDVALRQAGVRVAHLGGVRLDGKGAFHPAAGIATATVWPELAPDPEGPAKRPLALAGALEAILPLCDLCLIDIGDTTRIEMSPLRREERQRLRRRAITRYEPLWKALIPIAASGVKVWILSPCPPGPSDGHWERLTPVVYVGQGKGLLTSGTTKMPGLIANIDVAPTLLRDAVLPPPVEMTGRPVRVRPRSKPWTYLRRVDHLATLNYRASPPVMIGFGAFYVLLLGGVVAALTRSKISYSVFLCLRYGLMAAAASSVSFLLVSSLTPRTVGQLAWQSVIITLLLAAAAFGMDRKTQLGGLTWLLLGTCLVIGLDTIFQGPLVRDSVVSSFILSGIRYYGLGNEHMGVLLGAGVMVPALLADDLKLPKNRVYYKIIIGIWFLGVAALIGLPVWGANFGGAIAAAPACVLAALALTGSRLTRRSVAFALAGMAVMAVVFALWDMSQDVSSQTHVGRLLGRIRGGGIEPFREVAIGKLRMHLNILLSPQAWIPTLVSLALLAWLVTCLQDKIMRAFGSRPSLQAVLPAVLTASALALLANDSGIVPLAFIVGSWVFALLDAMLQTESVRADAGRI